MILQGQCLVRFSFVDRSRDPLYIRLDQDLERVVAVAVERSSVAVEHFLSDIAIDKSGPFNPDEQLDLEPL